MPKLRPFKLSPQINIHVNTAKMNACLSLRAIRGAKKSAKMTCVMMWHDIFVDSSLEWKECQAKLPILAPS